jgi:hypothetical protein
MKFAKLYAKNGTGSDVPVPGKTAESHPQLMPKTPTAAAAVAALLFVLVSMDSTRVAADS